MAFGEASKTGGTIGLLGLEIFASDNVGWDGESLLTGSSSMRRLDGLSRSAEFALSCRARICSGLGMRN